MKRTLIIIGIIVVVVGLSLFSYYNKFVTANEAVDGQWAQVGTQYERRFSLIPNLVESVKGVMTQEKEVFGMIADARTKYAGAGTANEKAGAATEVESAFARLLVVMENYPQLKSAENVNNLTEQLESAENRISVARKRYNDSVLSYNTMTKRVPANMVAGVFGFDERNYFKSTEGSEKAPEVQF